MVVPDSPDVVVVVLDSDDVVVVVLDSDEVVVVVLDSDDVVVVVVSVVSLTQKTEWLTTGVLSWPTDGATRSESLAVPFGS